MKGGCLEGLDWKTAIHIWTKSAMVPIPEGSESYEGEPTDSEYSSNQEMLDQPADPPGILMNNGGPYPDARPTEEVARLAKTKGLCELSADLNQVSSQ